MLGLTVHHVSLPRDEIERHFRDIYGLVRHHQDTGLLTWAEDPQPVMLVWAPRIFEFLQVLEGVISYLPARGLCREVGYRSGHDGAVASAQAPGSEPPGPLAMLLALPRILVGAGWGASELTYDDATGRLTWTFPTGSAVGVSARASGNGGTPACAFYEGFGAGWVKGSTGRDVEFMETACVGRGDAACRFESRELG